MVHPVREILETIYPSPEFLSSVVAKKFIPLPQGARGYNCHSEGLAEESLRLVINSLALIFTQLDCFTSFAMTKRHLPLLGEDARRAGEGTVSSLPRKFSVCLTSSLFTLIVYRVKIVMLKIKEIL